MNPFPIHLYPNPLADYVREAAESLGCDPAYIGVPLLPVLASSIGNTRRIRLKADWTEPSVVWAAIVGESGAIKSPALELATRPVWKRQRAIIRAYQQAMAEYKSEHADWKTASKEHRGDEPEPPPAMEHPICSDITIEALADRLEKTPRGILIALDELAGWFGSFNAYKSGGGDIAHWLSLHGARAMKVDRKTGDKTTTYIPHAAASVTGTIQPETLRRVLVPEYFESGLVARLLLGMPATRAKQWTDNVIAPGLAGRVDAVFESLYALRPCAGVEGDAEPVMVDLDDGGREAWVAFVNQHNIELLSLSGPTRAAWAKLEAYAARFALIFHCVRKATDEIGSDFIDANEIEGGITLAKWFGVETQRVYRAMSESASDRARRELMELVHRLGGRVTPRVVKEHCRKYQTSDDAEAALNKLVDNADGSWTTIRSSGRGGRPSKVFCLADSPDFPARSVPETLIGNGKRGLAEPERPHGLNKMEMPL